ncbi:MAG: hypothetical protein MR278_02280 [Bacteroidales bacterium]|nr:hypothetical protein [Anaerotignum sp.]MCI5678800.1 hypothetical protein [Bacteroidales bacterium]MDY3927707.1 hypothetical protein [Anaerotignum sp.]
MATYTENYNLTKPDAADYYDVSDFNENMDMIDEQLMNAELELAGVSEKIGEPSDSGKNTLFGCLNAGSSPIKSIQHVTYAAAKSTTSGSVSIQTVDPSKCIVLFERLSDTASNGSGRYEYTLTDSAISLKHNSFDSNNNLVGFWVIEFN